MDLENQVKQYNREKHENHESQQVPYENSSQSGEWPRLSRDERPLWELRKSEANHKGQLNKNQKNL